MARLSPFLPFISDETPLSWAGRLAAFHTAGELSHFLGDLRIPVLDLAVGKPDAVLRLCDLAGQDPVPVLANAIVGVSRRRHTFRGMTVCAEFLSGRITRFCPLCLLEDGDVVGRPQAAWRHRLEWRFATVRTCSVHGLQLAEKRSGSWADQIPDLQRIIQTQDIDLGELADTLPRRPVSPMQAYVLDRIAGKPGPGWLDAQGIDQAVRACEMFGGLLAFGPLQKAADLDIAGWDTAGASGWRVAAQGEEAIRNELVAARSMIKKDAPEARFAAVYGMLYAWLTNTRMSKDPGPIRDLLRDVIVEHVPLTAGQKLLGVRIGSPRLGTVLRVAQQEKVNSVTLRNILVAKGILAERDRSLQPGRIIVDHAVAQSAAKSLKSSISVHRAIALLGTSKPLMRVLIESGWLHRLRDAEQNVSVKGMGLNVEDVHRLLAWIDAQLPAIDTEPSGFVDLAKASEKCRTPIRHIIEHLRRGELGAVRLVDRIGFDAVRVNLAKTRIEVSKMADQQNQDGREAADREETSRNLRASAA